MKPETKKKILMWYGYAGAFLIVVGFGLLSFGVIGPRDLSYQLLNLVGANGILLYALTRKDYPSAVLNIIFALIALITLALIIFFA